MGESSVVELIAAVGFAEGIWQLSRMTHALVHELLHLSYPLIDEASESFQPALAIDIAFFDIGIAVALVCTGQFALVDFVVEQRVVLLHVLEKHLIILLRCFK